jgi:DNA-binding response OmpR family regulator
VFLQILNKGFNFAALSGIPGDVKSRLAVRILVLEDYAGIRSALELMLEWEGHTVVGFERGDLALDFLRKQSVDFVLMDWNTPGISGVKFLEELEEVCLPLFRPRVGVLSGDPEGKIAVDRYGAEFFFMKPFTPVDVVENLKLSA